MRSLGRLSAGQLLDPVSLTMTASGAAAAAARGDLAGLLAALGRPVHWGLASFAPGVALDDAHRAALRAFRPDQPYRSAAFHGARRLGVGNKAAGRRLLAVRGSGSGSA